MKAFIKSALPFGITRALARRHERQRLAWMGLASELIADRGVDRINGFVEACRFNLWPKPLRVAPHDWVLVDVGANAGQFLGAALGLVSPRRVVAFEPQPALSAKLADEYRPRPEVEIVAAAVGAWPGEISLNVTDDDTCSSILRPSEQSYRRSYGGYSPAVLGTVQVPLVTLDQRLETLTGRIGLLKIDVQGYELNVLDGAREVLGRTDAVMVEVNYISHYEGAATFDDVHRFLTAAGFALTGVSAPYFNGEQVPTFADAVYSVAPSP